MVTHQGPLKWWFLLNQKIASTRPGAWFYSHTLHHIDRVLLRLSGGRLSAPRVFAGFPVILITTIGAKSGKERTLPLLGIRDDEDWIVIASNFGSKNHPAWYFNLRANPSVEVTYRDETNQYTASEVTGDEREQFWERAQEIYIGFESYQERAGDREIPVIRLSQSNE